MASECTSEMLVLIYYAARSALQPAVICMSPAKLHSADVTSHCSQSMIRQPCAIILIESVALNEAEQAQVTRTGTGQ